MSIASSDVETALRACLVGEGYSLTERRVNGETGVDIIATKGRDSLHIEVIGFKSSAPTRARDFFEVFFRAISRCQEGAFRCVIALPARFQNGLRQRAGHYGCAWSRLGEAFPELEIWLVDTETPAYTVSRWNDWLNHLL